MYGIFRDTAHWRVDEDDSATSSFVWLEFERCNALHNAIVRYGRLKCGHDLSDLSKQTRWPSRDDGAGLEGVESRLNRSTAGVWGYSAGYYTKHLQTRGTPRD